MAPRLAYLFGGHGSPHLLPRCRLGGGVLKAIPCKGLGFGWRPSFAISCNLGSIEPTAYGVHIYKYTNDNDGM